MEDKSTGIVPAIDETEEAPTPIVDEAAKKAPAKKRAPRKSKAVQKVDDGEELHFIYSGHDARNRPVNATLKEVHHKGYVIKVANVAEAKKVFEECVADSQTF